MIWTTESALETMKQVLSLADRHKKLLIERKISSLLSKPHLSAKEVSESFQVSYQTAQTMIDHFLELNILTEITGKKRDRRYIYWEYLDFLAEGTKIEGQT